MITQPAVNSNCWGMPLSRYVLLRQNYTHQQHSPLFTSSYPVYPSSRISLIHTIHVNLFEPMFVRRLTLHILPSSLFSSLLRPLLSLPTASIKHHFHTSKHHILLEITCLTLFSWISILQLLLSSSIFHLIHSYWTMQLQGSTPSSILFQENSRKIQLPAKSCPATRSPWQLVSVLHCLFSKRNRVSNWWEP